jgi:penicillin-binding protein 2
MHEEDIEQAQSGKEVQLTIDLDLQTIAERAFSADQSGAIVILDPWDGAIKALVSYPNFDPNRFLKPLSTFEWQRDFQQQSSPLLNRATQGLYPAASLFKLVTFAAGLEEGIITTDTEFVCKGHFLFCGRRYYCLRSWGHGLLNAQDALAYSCNIPCYEIAEKMDIDMLAWYAYQMGLGNETGLFLPEKSGLIPTKAWKQAVKHESWWQGETLSASIGQSFIMVTPLQMACMLGCIFTGYRVRPRIVTDELIQKHPVFLSEETRRFLQESMALGVQKGTSRRLAVYEQFTMYAKTGTAQISNLRTQKEKCTRSQFEHGWIGVCFAYQNQKPYILVVLVEHAGTSRAATEVAQKILKYYEQIQKQKKSVA